jgi:predicted GIY-YIG superfamily endonuclease
MQKKHYWLYVLRLQEGKYYVGKTSREDPHERIKEHMQGFYSAQWVKKYKPIEPTEILDIGNLTDSEADKLENYRTLQYMKKYGYQNVRGGKFNYSGKYYKIADWYWRDEVFEPLVAILILMLAIVALLLPKIFTHH